MTQVTQAQSAAVDLKWIKAARRRLADGTINMCEECGREIGHKRLLPTRPLCAESNARHNSRNASFREYAKFIAATNAFR
jgi:RNA polymerase-binding transcription factor DksA